MSFILATLCSPRRWGITEMLGRGFVVGARSTGAPVLVCALRELSIAPCCGCGKCGNPPHACILANKHDDAEKLFSYIARSSLAVFFSPIYFYGVPAKFKAFIDRGQRFWAATEATGKALSIPYPKPAIIVLSAGRMRGKLLFSGALRTCGWFLKIINRKVIETFTLRGADSALKSSHIGNMANTLFYEGQKWGRAINSENIGIEL